MVKKSMAAWDGVVIRTSWRHFDMVLCCLLLVHTFPTLVVQRMRMPIEYYDSSCSHGLCNCQGRHNSEPTLRINGTASI
jgi:hypothetical protein